MKASRFAEAVGCMRVLCAIAHAQVPQLINYQGRVVVGTTNFNGAGQFKFALVNGDSTNYEIAAGNFFGAIVNAVPAGSPTPAPVSGSTAPSSISTTDPWANINY